MRTAFKWNTIFLISSSHCHPPNTEREAIAKHPWPRCRIVLRLLRTSCSCSSSSSCSCEQPHNQGAYKGNLAMPAANIANFCWFNKIAPTRLIYMECWQSREAPNWFLYQVRSCLPYFLVRPPRWHSGPDYSKYWV